MSRHTHFNYRRSFLAVVLVFLTGLCMASPALNRDMGSQSGLSAADVCCALSINESDCLSVSNYSFRTKESAASVTSATTSSFFSRDSFSSQNIVENKISDFPAYLIPVPGYYSLLYQYHMF